MNGGMNGLNRNCVFISLDRPRRRIPVWDLVSTALAVAAFIFLLAVVGE